MESTYDKPIKKKKKFYDPKAYSDWLTILKAIDADSKIVFWGDNRYMLSVFLIRRKKPWKIAHQKHNEAASKTWKQASD